jgi:hypothetical protein
MGDISARRPSLYASFTLPEVALAAGRKQSESSQKAVRSKASWGRMCDISSNKALLVRLRYAELALDASRERVKARREG